MRNNPHSNPGYQTPSKKTGREVAPPGPGQTDKEVRPGHERSGPEFRDPRSRTQEEYKQPETKTGEEYRKRHSGFHQNRPGAAGEEKPEGGPS